MRFVFGYAGIPVGAYDYIYRMRKTLTDNNVEFEGAIHGKAGSPFEPRHANLFLARFKEHAIKSRGNDKWKIGFAVIYVRSDLESTAKFEEAFFPSTLVFPVDWHLTGRSPQEINQSCKELFDLLLQATIRARIAIEALHKEVVERANRTPLLLPIRNFRSKLLRSWMRELQTKLASQRDVSTADFTLKAAVKQFEARYPLVLVEGPKRLQPCYLDDHNVEYHTPGKALHGLPHATDGHPVSCILGAYRRLGAPFNAAFHYDCRKGRRGNLKGQFFTCHEVEAVPMEGDPHINIAPNDFIRI